MTIQELIETYFNRPDVAEQLAALKATWDPVLGIVRQLHAMVTDIGRAVEASSPSPGYEPYLVQRMRAHPLLARVMAMILVRHGKRVAADRRRQPEAVRAIRFLAKPGRKKKVFDRNVAVLLSASNETSALQTLFLSAELDETEFLVALKRVADGDLAARDRVVEIATTVAPLMVVPRGRPVTASSAAHRILVERLMEVDFERKTPHGYSYSDVEEDFVDLLTKATRREFGDPDFDPRPVRRRIRASRKVTA